MNNVFWRETARAYMALPDEELQRLPPEEQKEVQELIGRYRQSELRQQGMKKMLLAMLVALAVGGYLGYSFTSSHYRSIQATENKRESTAVCRLELREGNRGDVKEKYIALLEYRNEDGGLEFCERHTPTDSLPSSTNGVSLDSLYSEEYYDEQVQINE